MTVELHHKLHEHTTDQAKHAKVHKKKLTQFVDRVVLAVGIISPLTSLPQVYQIIETKNTQGISTLTWSLYLVLAFFWLLYGIVHEEKPIIVNNVLWIIFDVIIIVLIFMYRG